MEGRAKCVGLDAERRACGNAGLSAHWLGLDADRRGLGKMGRLEGCSDSGAACGLSEDDADVQRLDDGMIGRAPGRGTEGRVRSDGTSALGRPVA